MALVVSGRDMEKILEAWKGLRDSVVISPDLGITKTRAVIEGDTLILGGKRIDLEKSFRQKLRRDSCYVLDGDVLVQLKWYDPETRLLYKLVPTRTWPTVKLSGTPMHRYAKIDPKMDTESKIDTIMPVEGCTLLDTCMGLGYTSIVSVERGARLVHTFERDPNIIEMARINPYSRLLFTSERIVLHHGDVTKSVRDFGDEVFDRIVHDPPTPFLSPELYTLGFYRELYRVARPGALLYHYLPRPGRLSGRAEGFVSTVMKRLERAGFVDIERDEKSSGLVARRPPR